MKQRLDLLNQKIAILTEDVQKRETEKTQLTQQISTLTQDVQKRESEKAQFNQKITALTQDVQKREEQLKHQSELLIQKDEQLNIKDEQLKMSEHSLKKAQEENCELKKQLESIPPIPTEQQILDSMFFNACEGNDLIRMRRLLKLGSNIEAKNSEGLTPLFHSLLNDWIEVASFLLIRKANLESVNQDGQTILHVACKQGNLKKFKFILPYISKYDREATLLLSAHEIASNAEIKQTLADTILFQASKQGNQKLTALILDKGANKEAREDSFTPLHTACYHNQFEIVKLLLSRGCSTTSKDQYDRVPAELTSKQEIKDLISKHQDDKATLIQKCFRGYRVRKKIFPKMQEAYQIELDEKSVKKLGELSTQRKYYEIIAFGTAMKERHFHEAAQIIDLRLREVHTRTGGKIKY